MKEKSVNTQHDLNARTDVVHNYSALVWPSPAFPRKVLVFKAFFTRLVRTS